MITMKWVKNPSKRRAALEMRLKGLTYAEIGKALGMTRQAAQQMTSPPAKVWRAVKDAADGKCCDCHVPIENGHVHHNNLDSIDNYNDIENLVYLCIACHQHRHAGPRRIKEAKARIARPQWLVDMLAEAVNRKKRS